MPDTRSSDSSRGTITLRVDGRALEVAAGSNVAAALEQATPRGFRRSLGGAPRGPLCGMGCCFECRVTIDGQPDQLACRTPCREGLRVDTADGLPNPQSRLPRSQLDPSAPEPPASGTSGDAWDVLVLGAGPAGLAAAVHAAEAGRRVALADAAPHPGGQIWRRDLADDDRRQTPVAPWLERLRAAGVTVLSDTQAVAVETRPETPEEPWTLTARSAGSPRSLRGHRLVVATGARERLLPFPGWTLPGVTGVGALQALLKGGTSLEGQSVVVAGSGPLLLVVAAEVQRRGGHLAALCEQAPFHRVARFGAGLWRHPGKLTDLLTLRQAFVGQSPRFATWPVRAFGHDRLEAVVLRDAAGRARTVAADRLACGFGLVPESRLAQLLGCGVDPQGRVSVDGHQATRIPGVFVAGEPTGIGGVDLALVEGAIAGLAAAEQPIPGTLSRARRRQHRFAQALERTFALRPELTEIPDNTLVCRCEDVSWGRLQGYDTPREAKLQTRCGMGPCQGRVCGPALETLLGWPQAPPRPPLEPTPLGVWAAATTQQTPSRAITGHPTLTDDLPVPGPRARTGQPENLDQAVQHRSTCKT